MKHYFNNIIAALHFLYHINLHITNTICDNLTKSSSQIYVIAILRKNQSTKIYLSLLLSLKSMKGINFL